MNGMSKAVGYLPMKRAQRKGIPDGAVVEINDRVWFVDHDGFRVVFRGWDTPLFRVAILGDTRFPGTDKRLKLAVRVPEPVIL